MAEPFHEERRRKAEVDYLLALDKLRKEAKDRAPTHLEIGKHIGLTEDETTALTVELEKKNDIGVTHNYMGILSVQLTGQGFCRLADLRYQRSIPWWKRLRKSVPWAPFWIAVWEVARVFFVTGKAPDWLLSIGKSLARILHL
jgi:hypothetical protein